MKLLLLVEKNIKIVLIGVISFLVINYILCYYFSVDRYAFPFMPFQLLLGGCIMGVASMFFLRIRLNFFQIFILLHAYAINIYIVFYMLFIIIQIYFWITTKQMALHIYVLPGFILIPLKTAIRRINENKNKNGGT